MRVVDSYIHLVSNLTVAAKLNNGIKLYDTFCIVQLRGQTVHSFDSFLLLGMGYFIIMLNTAATVTAWNVLPVEIAWIPPLLTFVSVSLLIMILPVSIDCYRSSQVLLQKWRKLARNSTCTKCLRKQLAARLPIGFQFGEFRPINREFRLVYLESIMERTSNQILVYKNRAILEL